MKPSLPTTLHHNHKFRLSTEPEILKCFRAKDQELVIFPRPMDYPFDVQYYFSWSEASGNYTYLIYKHPTWDKPMGMVLRRVNSALTTANTCDWCHSYGNSNDVGMLKVRITEDVTMGQYLCLNLDCLNKLDTQSHMTGKSIEMLDEQVCEKINRFYEKTILAPSK